MQRPYYLSSLVLSIDISRKEEVGERNDDFYGWFYFLLLDISIN